VDNKTGKELSCLHDFILHGDAGVRRESFPCILSSPREILFYCHEEPGHKKKNRKNFSVFAYSAKAKTQVKNHCSFSCNDFILIVNLMMKVETSFKNH
jgi:hypothetical protein